MDPDNTGIIALTAIIISAIFCLPVVLYLVSPAKLCFVEFEANGIGDFGLKSEDYWFLEKIKLEEFTGKVSAWVPCNELENLYIDIESDVNHG